MVRHFPPKEAHAGSTPVAHFFNPLIMELRLLHLPSGTWYGRFTEDELEELREIHREIARLTQTRFKAIDLMDFLTPRPGPTLEEAKLTNRARRIEQRAIERVG